MPRIKQRHTQRNPHLAESFWNKLGGAFTDPEKRFEFPVKPFEMDFTPESKNAMYATAGILALGAIATALIISNKNK